MKPIFDIDCYEVIREGDTVNVGVVPLYDTFELSDIAQIQWSFPGAIVEAYTVVDPSVTYTSRGRYGVYCKITLTTGETSLIYKHRKITVTYSLTGRTTHVINLATLPDLNYYQKLLDNSVVGAVAGDIVQFSGDLESTYGLYMRDFNGEDDNPIIFTNTPGQTSHINYEGTNPGIENGDLRRNNVGIYARSCTNCVIDGKNGNLANDFFGININTLTDITGEAMAPVFVANAGLKLEFFSHKWEVYGIYFPKTGFPAIQAKTEPDSTSVYDARWDDFVFEDLIIHHTHIDECMGEMYYLGYNNFYPQNVAGKDIRPHKMQNLLLYRNYGANSQKDAFQYGNYTGVVEIHDNTWVNPATLVEYGQSSGMSVNATRDPCSTYIYNNKILSYPGYAIQIWITNQTHIFNNLMVAKEDNEYGVLYVHNNTEMNAEVFNFSNNTTIAYTQGNLSAINMNKEPFPETDPDRIIEFLCCINNLHMVSDAEEISTEAGNTYLLNTFAAYMVNGYNGGYIDTMVSAYTVENNIFYGTSRINEFDFIDSDNGVFAIGDNSVGYDAGRAYPENVLMPTGFVDSDLHGLVRDNGVYNLGAFESTDDNGLLFNVIVPTIGITKVLDYSSAPVNDEAVPTILAKNYGSGDVRPLYYMDLDFNIYRTVSLKQSIEDEGFVYVGAGDHQGRDMARFKDGTNRFIVPEINRIAHIFNEDGSYTGQFVDLRPQDAGGAQFPEACEMRYEGGKNLFFIGGRNRDTVFEYEISETAVAPLTPLMGDQVGILLNTYPISDQEGGRMFGFRDFSDGYTYMIDGNTTRSVYRYNPDFTYTGWSKNLSFNDTDTIGNFYAIEELPAGYTFDIDSHDSTVRVPDGQGGFTDQSTGIITLQNGGAVLSSIEDEAEYGDCYILFDDNWDVVCHFYSPAPEFTVPGPYATMAGLLYMTIGTDSDCFNNTIDYIESYDRVRVNSDDTYRLDSNGEYIIDKI
jgi:hypothetical protein